MGIFYYQSGNFDSRIGYEPCKETVLSSIVNQTLCFDSFNSYYSYTKQSKVHTEKSYEFIIVHECSLRRPFILESAAYFDSSLT